MWGPSKKASSLWPWTRKWWGLQMPHLLSGPEPDICVEHCEDFRRILIPPRSEATRTDMGFSQLLALHHLTSISRADSQLCVPHTQAPHAKTRALQSTFKPFPHRAHPNPCMNPCVYECVCVCVPTHITNHLVVLLQRYTVLIDLAVSAQMAFFSFLVLWKYVIEMLPSDIAIWKVRFLKFMWMHV